MLFFAFIIPRILFAEEPNILEYTEEQCLACIYQRKANLPYIIRRAVHQSGPDENQTFGHCFVCVRCADDPIDFCRGWWPEDPDGGDYEGDQGLLAADHDEHWDRANCRAISKNQSDALRLFLQQYEKNNRYQVLNKDGARSCLGFCEDVAKNLDWKYQLWAGNLTIPGQMCLSDTAWKEKNIADEMPPSFQERLWNEYFSSDD